MSLLKNVYTSYEDRNIYLTSNLIWQVCFEQFTVDNK